MCVCHHSTLFSFLIFNSALFYRRDFCYQFMTRLLLSGFFNLFVAKSRKFPENSSQRILSSEENPRGKSLIKENYFPTQFVPYGKTMTRFASGCKNVTEIFHLRAVRKRVGGFGVKDDFINPRCLFCLIVQRIFTDSQA